MCHSGAGLGKIHLKNTNLYCTNVVNNLGYLCELKIYFGIGYIMPTLGGDDCNLTSFKIFSTAPLNSLPSSMLSFHVPLHGGEKVTFLVAEDAKPQSTQLSPTLEFSEYLEYK